MGDSTGYITAEHEVITPTGWKFVSDLTADDRIAQWNIEDSSVQFVHPTAIVSKYYNGEVFELTSRNGKVYQVGTPDRKILLKDRDGKYTSHKMRGFQPIPLSRLPTSGRIESKPMRLSEVERIYIATQADGGLTTCGNGYRVCVKLDRKVERFQRICSEGGFEYAQTKRKTNIVETHVEIPESLRVDNVKAFDWFKLDEVGIEWGQQFVDEVSHWDGSLLDGVVKYYSVDRPNIDKLHALAQISGFNVLCTTRPPRENVVFGNMVTKLTKERYILDINPKNDCVSAVSMKVVPKPYKGMVYCVSVGSGYTIAKHKNMSCVICA